MHDQFDVTLEDDDLLGEVELTTTLIIAASESDEHLSQTEIAARMGTSITTALRTALQERLARTRPRVEVAFSDIQAIIDRGRARPVLDERSQAEILGYDEHGLPT